MGREPKRKRTTDEMMAKRRTLARLLRDAEESTSLQTKALAGPVASKARNWRQARAWPSPDELYEHCQYLLSINADADKVSTIQRHCYPHWIRIDALRARSSETLNGQCLQSLKDANCEVIFSAPGTFFLAGEKAINHGAIATCMKIPHRVYVGLGRRDGGSHPSIDEVVDSKIWELGLHGIEPKDYGAKHPELNRAFIAAQTALPFITGSKLKASYRVYIRTSFAGDYGMGWSGAFSAAFAAALLYCELPSEEKRKWDLASQQSLWGSKTQFEGFLGSRLIKSTIPWPPPGRQKPGSFARACHNAWRYA